ASAGTFKNDKLQAAEDLNEIL
ncbi:MAG: hypothetical protein QG567_1535, partial [Campylobacterota bacterium]|nr:hypothetical protein [Campylobacterota bacterium]